MRTFILFLTFGAVAAFAPQPRQLLSPATTQMTTAATAAPCAKPIATSRSIQPALGPALLEYGGGSYAGAPALGDGTFAGSYQQGAIGFPLRPRIYRLVVKYWFVSGWMLTMGP